MSEKVLIHVINKVTNELKKLSYDKRIIDFDKNGYFYKIYFGDGTLRLFRHTIIYSENYVNKLELACDEIILNGVKYSLGNCSIEVDTLLEKRTEEVYNLYVNKIMTDNHLSEV